MEYRKDIDGLRAVAVVPVILFHAGVDVFNGGFLGVDIFFVISGFLITSILLYELKHNKFSIVNFYERRARRILPALFLVLFCSCIAAYVLMPPFELKEFSQSLVSVVSFLSNIFFYTQIDYFSLAAEEMPLLHTWSLAIEEQYYIFFPLFLAFVWRFGFQKILLSLIVIFVFSLLIMMLLNAYGYYSASFYWPVSRVWELLAGSIAAFLMFNDRVKESRYLADIGLMILLACLILWPSNLSHPSLWVVIPVVATCLIVLFPCQVSISFKLLSNQKIVYVGLISYSLYLWHQPIFAFIRMKTIGLPSSLVMSIAVVFTFVCAYLSYKYVETPFRNKSVYSRKYIFTGSCAFLILFFCAGVVGHLKNGVPERFEESEIYLDSMEHSPKRQLCHSSDDNYLKPEQACVYFDKDVSWAVLGDSHMVEPAYALADVLQQKGLGLSHHTYSGCPPAINYQIKGKELCTQWLGEQLTYLEQNDQIKNIVIGFRYSASMFGDNVDVYPSIPDQVLMSDIVSDRSLSEVDRLEVYWRGLKEIVDRLLAANKNIILLEPIPELPMHIGRAVSAFSIFGNATLVDLGHATSKNYYEQRHEYILEKLRGLSLGDNFLLVNVYDLICHQSGCPAVIDGYSLYFDDDHLSVAGAKIMLKRLVNRPEYKRLFE